MPCSQINQLLVKILKKEKENRFFHKKKVSRTIPETDNRKKNFDTIKKKA